MTLSAVVGNIGLSASSESIYQTKHGRGRGSLRHRPHRTSSRRNKENGSGSFRRKNSFKKSNVLAVTENVKKLNCTVQNSGSSGGSIGVGAGVGGSVIGGNNGSNSTLNGEKLFKLSFQNSDSNDSSMIDASVTDAATVAAEEAAVVAQNKSHTVTFGEMPIVVKVTPAAKNDQTVPMDQELHDQPFSCEFSKGEEKK